MVKAEARSSTELAHVGGLNPRLWTIIGSVPGAIAGVWNGNVGQPRL